MNFQLCSPYSLRTTVVRVLNTPQSLIEISIDYSVPGVVFLQHENASEQFVARGGRTGTWYASYAFGAYVEFST